MANNQLQPAPRKKDVMPKQSRMALIGCVSGIITIALLVFITTIFKGITPYQALFFPTPGLVFGISITFFLADRTKSKILLRSIAAIILMMLGYFLAVVAFFRIGEILSPNGPVYQTSIYLTSMVSAGAIGSFWVAMAAMIIGINFP